MKIVGTLGLVLALSLLTACAAVAQPPSGSGPAQPPAASAPRPGMPADQAHMEQMTEMCRQMMGHAGMSGAGMGHRMMGGGMAPGMMRDGMMGPGGMMGGMGMMPPMMMSADPKQQAEMLAMRGEMMKAMGDIMLKYAQRAQQSAK